MDFVVNLEYKPSVPLFRRLSDALRRSIIEGRLSQGQAMPSVRDLSTSLHISRATVLKSFDDLCKQGYLVSFRGAGTFVAEKLPGELADVLAEKSDRANTIGDTRVVEFTAYGRRVLDTASFKARRKVQLPDINFGGPPMTDTLLNQWRQILLRHCRLKTFSQLAYAVEPFGYLPLREALGAYLHRARSVKCSPEQTVISSSKQFRLNIIGRLLIEPGDFVAFEEPGYPEARLSLTTCGANIVPIPVDDQGINVDYLRSVSQRLKLVYVTPSHQDPTGVEMSLERRKQLLAWAHETGAFIVEDDYDSLYRYGTKSLPSLQGLDDGDCVIYFSSLWQVLFPLVRLGFLIVPQCLREPLYIAKMNIEPDLPLLEQFALTDFINEGHLERYIKRTWSVYARRRNTLIHALTLQLKETIVIAPQSAGMHLLVHIKSDLNDAKLVESASQSGVSLVSTEHNYLGVKRSGEFIMPFAHIEETALESGIRAWSELIKEHR